MQNEKAILGNIIRNIEQVIFGKKINIVQVLIALLSEGHVLIEDVPGVGKTSLVTSLAKSVSCTFNRIQFTPDILPSDITGYTVYNPKNGEFDFKSGAIMNNIILADEINRTSPKTQANMLEAMEERQITVDGVTYMLPKPFMVLATQNPVEYLGTYPLPEAQLDRFIIKISLSYPNRENEMKMLAENKFGSPIEKISPVASADDIMFLQSKVREVFINEVISTYILDIVSATRNNQWITLGGSPRASLALYRTSQAMALMSGRDYVIPDDVKAMALPVLSHRLILSREASIKNMQIKTVVEDIVAGIPIPAGKV